ncbi:MAG: hypothetical protein ACO2PM_01355 [Pyrobaculum sp.]
MPSWRVHRTLALQTSAGLSKEVVKGLLKGVVEPDVVADGRVMCKHKHCRAVRIRHHAGVPRGLVEYYFNLACFYRARGDLHAAGRALGRALHYIHDGAVKTRRWLLLNVHDEVEQEMERLVDALPDLCLGVTARRSNKAAEALCFAYVESRRLVERFISEPLPTRKAARGALWRGRAKKWGLAAAALAVGAAAGFPAGLLGFLAGAVFLLWTPGEYVAAMRGGVACVKPRRYVPALTC